MDHESMKPELGKKKGWRQKFRWKTLRELIADLGKEKENPPGKKKSKRESERFGRGGDGRSGKERKTRS